MRSIINILILIFPLTLFAQQADSVKKVVPKEKVSYVPTGIRVGTDLISLIRTQTDENFSGYEFNADIDFYRWGIGAILNWENETVPANVTHIHGTNDKLLPYHFVKADFTINNGGHLMVIDNAREVSSRIKEIISS